MVRSMERADSSCNFAKKLQPLSRLNHFNIATVHDFDTQGDVYFIVTELVERTPLAEKVKSGPLPEKEVSALDHRLPMP
jgi:hypothetical protein